jgi:hypothetical protein
MSSKALKRVLKLLKKEAQCNVGVINPKRSSQVLEEAQCNTQEPKTLKTVLKFWMKLNVTRKSPKP